MTKRFKYIVSFGIIFIAIGIISGLILNWRLNSKSKEVLNEESQEIAEEQESGEQEIGEKLLAWKGLAIMPLDKLGSETIPRLKWLEEYPGMPYPQLDLHVYTDDGRHIGVNYETGEFENQIPNSYVSGDIFGGREWIYIPTEITNAHFAVSSKRNEEFLNKFPELKQYTDGIDKYEVRAKYINPDLPDYYYSTTITQEIKLGIELEHVITGTTDITSSSGQPFDFSIYIKLKSN